MAANRGAFLRSPNKCVERRPKLSRATFGTNMDGNFEETFWILLGLASTYSMSNSDQATKLLEEAKAIETKAQTPFRIRAQLEIHDDSEADAIRELSTQLLNLWHDMPLEARIETLQVILEAGIRTGDRSIVRKSINELVTLSTLPRVPPHKFFHAISQRGRRRLTQLFLTLHRNCEFEAEFCDCQNVGAVLRDYWGLLADGRKIQTTKNEIRFLFPERWRNVTDHLDALESQLKPLGVSSARIRQQGETISLVFGELEEEFKNSDDLADALSDLKVTHSIFCQPYMTKAGNRLEQFAAKLPRIQFSYGPFLAASDYFSTFGRNGEFLFNGYLQADLVAAQNLWTRDIFISSGIAKSRVSVIGDPLMWNLVGEPHSDVQPTYDLLWAPHFSRHGSSPKCPGYGNAEDDLSNILQIADEGVRVLIRAHPNMLKSLNKLRPDFRYQTVISESLKHPNITYSTGSIETDLLSAQRCVTDGVSIIIYACLLKRPVCIRRRPDSAGFRPEWRALINRLPQMTSVSLEGLPDVDNSSLDLNQQLAIEIAEINIDDRSPGEALLSALYDLR